MARIMVYRFVATFTILLSIGLWWTEMVSAQNLSHVVRLESQSKSMSSPQLSTKLDEFLTHHHHNQVRKSVPIVSYNVTSSNTMVDDLNNGHGSLSSIDDSQFIHSLKSIKLMNSVQLNKKKAAYPGIVFQNYLERQLDEEMSDDLTKFEAYSKLLSKLMHSIANKDLGLSVMKQKIEKVTVESTPVTLDSIIDAITDKIQRKIDDVHEVIEITGERIQEIFKQQLVSNISTNHVSCCDFHNAEFVKASSINNAYSNDHELKVLTNIKTKEQDVRNSRYQFDRHFNTWINKQFACDIRDDNRRPPFFSPSGPNLTHQFMINLERNPNIKWQYFMTLVGVHTEYPSYLPPNNYCSLHTINKYQMNRMYIPKKITPIGYKIKSKKYDALYHHQRTYNELNQYFSQRHRENLLSTALPQSKLVVIVIDRGSALTDHQLNIAKSVAKYILNSLSHKDKVALVDLTSDIQYPGTEICSSKLEVAYANYETKHSYSRYIDGMQRSHNLTNHFLGFKKAFEIIANTYKSFKEDSKMEPEIFIPYISRGLLASLTDAKPVMELIASELKNCSYTFVINCYALIDESKPIMYETTFLREIALMNFRKFNVDSPPSNKIRAGIMVALNNTDSLSFTLNGIYTVLNKPENNAQDNIYISMPHFDFISKDTHLSLSKNYYFRDRFLGVVGVDISFSDFAEDVIHYDDQRGNSYAFLMDVQTGKLLYHPVISHHNQFEHKHGNKYSSINYEYNQPNTLINVEHIEQANEFRLVKKAIVSKVAGSQLIRLSFGSNNESHFEHQSRWEKPYTTIKYYWRHIRSSSFAVVIAEYGFDDKCTTDKIDTIKYVSDSPSDTFVSHRLDFLPSLVGNYIRLCKHFNQLSTIDSGSLFLTSSSFVNSNQSEFDLGSIDLVQRYMNYLTDTTNTIKNPGLKENIRGDVHLMSSITNIWKELLDSSETSKYIVRKYISTSSGAFMVFPGTLLDSSYEPRSRPWFTRAIADPSQLVFMAPYLDIGGAGYIITLSQAIMTRSNGQTVWAVMAIDLTLGYFHKIIDEMVPICSGSKSSCFIMDEYGTLIVHSSFLMPTLTSYIERQHITHKEPQMINDLLNQKNFVRKLVCNSYNDRTIQRYYKFNTSLVGILTNIVQNDDSSCAKYKLVSLEGTNAFFGIVNHTCDNSTTFCPCSLTDRLCLNCHRMEQTDCECPCECPLMMDLCSGDLVEKEDNNPSCIPIAEPLQAPTVPKYMFDSLDSCVNSDCFNKHSESECKGVLSCEWCSMDNGFKLKKPFCTNLNLCFGGIYRAKNPYMGSNHYYIPDDDKPVNNPPIGPLTCAMFIFFIVLIISAYCFHVQRNPSYGSRYRNHAEHQILPQSSEPNDLNNMNEYHNEHGNYDAVVSLVHASVNPNFENIASPYQVNTNYRRPRVESDYGYSTMTPNEDSEKNSSIYIDASLINKNKKIARLHDHLNISTSPTSADSSLIADDVSVLSSSPSSSSSIASSQRLPPPPFKISNKIRLKQKYAETFGQTKLANPLPTLNENSPFDDVKVN